jgi:hypothetical protein
MNWFSETSSQTKVSKSTGKLYWERVWQKCEGRISLTKVNRIGKTFFRGVRFLLTGVNKNEGKFDIIAVSENKKRG